GRWAMARIYGANARIGTGRLSNSAVVETNVDFDGTNAVFGRVEYVRKTAGDLVVASVPPETAYDVGALALGYHRALTRVGGVTAGIGVRGAVNVVPSPLEGVDGPSSPVGFPFYFTRRPARL